MSSTSFSTSTKQLKYSEPSPNINGWMSPEELQWLYELGMRSRTIVEVGCWFGRSTHALLSGQQQREDVPLLIAVDHWRGNPTEINEAHAFAKSGDVRGEFVKNLRDFLHLIVMDTDSETSASLVNGPFDAVFIDGEHTFEACYADLQAWEKHVRLGGSLCGHDRLLKGVPDALSKFFGSVPKPFENTGLWELVKIEGGWRDAFAG